MVEGSDGLIYVYAHADSIFVKRGESVRKGQTLGRVGRWKDSCGITFEVRDKEGKALPFDITAL